jgi:hypothetical protein
MIFPWVGRREPTVDVILQLVTCQRILVLRQSAEVTNDSRFDLLMSLASCRITSNAQSDTISPVGINTMYRGHPERCRVMLDRLHRKC